MTLRFIIAFDPRFQLQLIINASCYASHLNRMTLCTFDNFSELRVSSIRINIIDQQLTQARQIGASLHYQKALGLMTLVIYLRRLLQ